MYRTQQTDPKALSAKPLRRRIHQSWMTAICALVMAVAVLFAPVVSTGVRLAASTIFMGWTLVSDPPKSYMDSSTKNFIVPALGGTADSYQQVPIYTPEQVWPFSGLTSDTINRSFIEGTADLDAAIAAQSAANPGEPIVVYGFSQSTAVFIREKSELIRRQAAGESVPDVTFIGTGFGTRPNGGINERLNGVYIPIIDYNFDGASPDTDSSFKTIDIARQYDGVADFPLYPLNLIADLNALFGILFVHTSYSKVSIDPTSPLYVAGTKVETHVDTTYYLIPTANLPLFDPLRLLGVPESLIDIVEPVARVLVEAGYDRTIPQYVPTPARLIPPLNLGQVASDLAAAVVQGVQNIPKVFQPGGVAADTSSMDLRVLVQMVFGVAQQFITNTLQTITNPVAALRNVALNLQSQITNTLRAVGLDRTGTVSGAAVSDGTAEERNTGANGESVSAPVNQLVRAAEPAAPTERTTASTDTAGTAPAAIATTPVGSGTDPAPAGTPAPVADTPAQDREPAASSNRGSTAAEGPDGTDRDRDESADSDEAANSDKTADSDKTANSDRAGERDTSGAAGKGRDPSDPDSAKPSVDKADRGDGASSGGERTDTRPDQKHRAPTGTPKADDATGAKKATDKAAPKQDAD